MYPLHLMYQKKMQCIASLLFPVPLFPLHPLHPMYHINLMHQKETHDRVSLLYPDYWSLFTSFMLIIL